MRAPAGSSCCRCPLPGPRAAISFRRSSASRVSRVPPWRDLRPEVPIHGHPQGKNRAGPEMESCSLSKDACQRRGWARPRNKTPQAQALVPPRRGDTRPLHLSPVNHCQAGMGRPQPTSLPGKTKRGDPVHPPWMSPPDVAPMKWPPGAAWLPSRFPHKVPQLTSILARV